MIKSLPALCLLSIVQLACVKTSYAASMPWAKFKTPTDEPSEVIGKYDAGCLKGAEAMPRDGDGFQVMRLSRSRFFGHPRLVGYLRHLGKQVKDKGLPDVLIGDLSLSHGGLMPGGHKSHQNGLDADIWFYHPTIAKRRLTLKEREQVGAISVANKRNHTLSKHWNQQQAHLLELAASSDEVERIFVNPAIKQALCQQADKDKQADYSWLSKLRPWWGHADHFHVRLICPSSDSKCLAQAPVPSGTGCDATLAWWFSEDYTKTMKENALKPKKPKPAYQIPQHCQTTLTQP